MPKVNIYLPRFKFISSYQITKSEVESSCSALEPRHPYCTCATEMRRKHDGSLLSYFQKENSVFNSFWAGERIDSVARGGIRTPLSDDFRSENTQVVLSKALLNFEKNANIPAASGLG